MEIAARERAEKKQQEYEERLRNMAEEMDRRQAELNEAQEMIRRLEEQLKQLQAAKEELENRQKVSEHELITSHCREAAVEHEVSYLCVFVDINRSPNYVCVLPVGVDGDDGEVGTIARNGGCGTRQTRTGDQS